MDLPGVSGEGVTRTDMSCTECGKGFIAELDFSLNGNHIIECPRCGHEHCRVIRDGSITEERWSSKNGGQAAHKARTFWKSSVLPAQTSIAALYLREKWLNLTQ
jgi:ribosomal protein S27AE